MITRVTASVPPLGDAHLEIHQLHVVDRRLIGAKILGQRFGQRIDRAAVMPFGIHGFQTQRASSHPPILTTTTASDSEIIWLYLFLRRSTVTR
jgi:hypothetical protein